MFYHYSANQPNYEYYNIALANARKRFTYLVQGYVLETYLLKKIERRMARNAKVIKNITAALSVGAILSMILAIFGVSNIWISISVGIAQAISFLTSTFTQYGDLDRIEILSIMIENLKNDSVAELQKIRYMNSEQAFSEAIAYYTKKYSDIMLIAYDIRKLRGYEYELSEANEEAFDFMRRNFG